MAWPETSDVICYGFAEVQLPAIRRAIDGEKVEWLKGFEHSGLFEGYGYQDFIWMDNVYRLEEYFEVVTGIILKGPVTKPN